MSSPRIEDKSNDKLTTNNLRRKSTSIVKGTPPPKAILLSNRKIQKVETNSIKEQPQIKTIDTTMTESNTASNQEINIKPRTIARSQNLSKINVPLNDNNHGIQSEQLSKLITSNFDTSMRNTSNCVNNISHGTQIVKLIDGNAIIMRPSTKTVVKKPITIAPIAATATTKPNSNVYMAKTISSNAVNQTYTTLKPSNIEITMNNCARLTEPLVKAHKIQIVTSDVPTISTNSNAVRATSNLNNGIISIPTTRNPNIVKTNDRTVIHVSPVNDIRTSKKLLTNVYNRNKIQQTKHMAQVNMQIQTKPKTVTIHPDSTFSRGKNLLYLLNLN